MATRPARPPTPVFISGVPKARGAGHHGAVLLDSGPLVALFNASDHWHTTVVDWLAGNPQARLVTTWPVLTEVCALLARRLHNEAALDVLRWIQRGGATLDVPADVSLTEILRVSERFADLPFDVADASVAETALRLRIRHILSIDSDFDVYRDKAGKPLVNLLAA